MGNNETTAAPRENDPLLGDTKGDEGTARTTESSGSEEEPSNNFVGTVIETLQEAVDGAQETFTEAVEGVQERAEQLQEGFMEEAADLKDVAKEKLHEADDGDMPILDMGLTRHLSILPSDITQVAAVVHDEDQGMADLDLEPTENMENAELPLMEPEIPNKPVTVPISAYFMLALAVIGLASVGPILNLQQGCSPLMKTVWRQNGTTLLMLPFVPLDWKAHGFPKLTCAQWINFVAAAAAYASGNLCFVTALEYTAVGNAVIFANSQTIILLVGKVLCGSHISLLEAGGALVAFSGAVLCSEDSASGSEAGASRAVLGDFIATLGGLSGVFYILFASSCRAHFTLFNFMFLIMVVSTIMTILFQILVVEEEVTFGMDSTTGIWGFLNMDEFDRFPLEFINVVICNICGAFGYVKAMQYFEPLVIAVAGLMQPVVATFVAYFIGVSMLPGAMGWIGNVLVVGGTVAVVYDPRSSTKKPSKEEELTSLEV